MNHWAKPKHVFQASYVSNQVHTNFIYTQVTQTNLTYTLYQIYQKLWQTLPLGYDLSSFTACGIMCQLTRDKLTILP